MYKSKHKLRYGYNWKLRCSRIYAFNKNETYLTRITEQQSHSYEQEGIAQDKAVAECIWRKAVSRWHGCQTFFSEGFYTLNFGKGERNP